jgi:hypothetical protein
MEDKELSIEIEELELKIAPSQPPGLLAARGRTLIFEITNYQYGVAQTRIRALR